MLKRRILASSMASVMALTSIASVAMADVGVFGDKEYVSRNDLKACIAEYDSFKANELYDYGSIQGTQFLDALEYASNVVADTTKYDADDVAAAYQMVKAVYAELTIYTAEQLAALIESKTADYENGNVLNSENDIKWTDASWTAFRAAYENAESALLSADSRTICDAYVELRDAKLTAMPTVNKNEFNQANQAFKAAMNPLKYDSWRRGTLTNVPTLYSGAAASYEGYTTSYGALYSHLNNVYDEIVSYYENFQNMKSINVTSNEEIVAAYRKCLDVTAVINSFKADNTTTARKANVDASLSKYWTRLVFDFNGDTAIEFINAIHGIVDGASGEVLLNGDTTAYDGSKSAIEDVTVLTHVSSDDARLAGAAVNVKADKSFVICLDSNGKVVMKADGSKFAIGLTADEANAALIDLTAGISGGSGKTLNDMSTAANRAAYLLALNSKYVANFAADLESVVTTTNGGDWSKKITANDDATNSTSVADLEAMRQAIIARATAVMKVSGRKIFSANSTNEVLQYVPISIGDVTDGGSATTDATHVSPDTNIDNHQKNNVVEGDYDSSKINDKFFGDKNSNKIIKPSAGTGYGETSVGDDGISYDGSEDNLNYVTLDVAVDMALAYVNGDYKSDKTKAIPDAIASRYLTSKIDTSGTLSANKVIGVEYTSSSDLTLVAGDNSGDEFNAYFLNNAAIEWAIVNRYLVYALSDKYGDAETATGKTREEVEALLADANKLLDLTEDASIFADLHVALVKTSQNIQQWDNAARADKGFKNFVTTVPYIEQDGTTAKFNSTDAWQELNADYDALNALYKKYKYSFGQVSDLIASASKVLDNDPTATALAAAIKEASFRLSTVQPELDAYGAQDMENAAFTDDREFQPINRVHTSGGNDSHKALTSAYEELLKAYDAFQNGATGLIGDINGDGVVTPQDAKALLEAYVNDKTGDLSLTIADLNNDGLITPVDAKEILKIYVNS